MKRKAVMLAPHPDDECIVGLLPLRLREEQGFEIIVVPATLGSRPERREARERELRAACGCIGFKPRIPSTVKTGVAGAEEIRALLEEIRPQAVFAPHSRDGHPTHRATHWLALEAMDKAGGAWEVVETEYWHPLEKPNLMVSSSRDQLDALSGALRQHRGEMVRNDYADRLPAWMEDNVRRGAELVGGFGAAAPKIAYATLYRWRRRSGGKWKTAARLGETIETAADMERWVDRLTCAWEAKGLSKRRKTG